MNIRALVVTSLLVATPFVSQAGEQDAMNACVKAFVTTSLEKERPYTVKTEDAAPSQITQSARAYRISLKAVGKETGTKVAKAECVVDRSGVVLSLNGKPYQPSDIVLSAR